MSPSLFLSLRSSQREQSKELLALAADAGVQAVLWEAGPLVTLTPAHVETLLATADQARLRPYLSIDLARFPPDHPLVAAYPALFAMVIEQEDGIVDPRAGPPRAAEARARLSEPAAAEVFGAMLAEQVAALAGQGVAGLLIRNADLIGPALRARLAKGAPDLLWEGGVITSGLSVVAATTFADLMRELGRPRRNVLARVDTADMLLPAAAVADGVIVEADVLADGVDRLARAAALQGDTARYTGECRLRDGPVLTVLRGDSPDLRFAQEARMTLINRDDKAHSPDDAGRMLAAAGFTGEVGGPLAPGEARGVAATRAKPITAAAAADASQAAAQPRLVVEAISPSVVSGDFAVKRVVGDTVEVHATVYADGHEQLAAELLWRAADESDWQRVPMEPLANDGWRAAFTPARLGRHEFAVEGWLDRFGGFQRDFGKKLAAEVAVAVDYAEGRQLVADAAARTGDAGLARAVEQLAAAGDGEKSAVILLSPGLGAMMRAANDRPHALRSPRQLLDAERIEARFSSWYELFPRSITDDPARHGTFDDVIARLPAIRAMGFDTLYFPPIHPIGRANRKGRNNTLTPSPDDPGSPYAIGGEEGGHDAIHPGLGGFEAFARLIAAAREHGLEIALDFAIQCSPDHPWLREHPGWFAWRPDGSMRYAENPPKKYQDIVNVDFYGPEAVPDLWLALRDVVLLWAGHGVKTFRVDNPHTKPLPFWEWMIADVRARHPDVIFLAEAFTRPNMMYRLAKIGFSQSYTYFTWRDRKQELTDYITELTTTAPRDFYRPHLFVNTPDINPIYLHTSGRPGFRIRAVLAATLSGLFGVYSGFELCEAAPVPGKEEYLDSEKYEIRPRDWQGPGNIIADITLLNRLRREIEALQTHLNTRFYPAHDENIIFYGKPSPDGSGIILVMVNLDPHAVHECSFEVPLWELGLPDDGSVDVEDLAEGWRFRWRGKYQTIRLSPDQPYRLWRIRP